LRNIKNLRHSRLHRVPVHRVPGAIRSARTTNPRPPLGGWLLCVGQIGRRRNCLLWHHNGPMASGRRTESAFKPRLYSGKGKRGVVATRIQLVKAVWHVGMST
jgi:hypothetical protein